MAKQGCVLSEAQIRKVLALLSMTDVTVDEIAERLDCSRGAVVAVNRKFQVRNYSHSKRQSRRGAAAK